MRVWMNHFLTAWSKFGCSKADKPPRKQKSIFGVSAPTCQSLFRLLRFTKYKEVLKAEKCYCKRFFIA